MNIESRKGLLSCSALKLSYLLHTAAKSEMKKGCLLLLAHVVLMSRILLHEIIKYPFLAPALKAGPFF